jgi:hypothetical protein
MSPMLSNKLDNRVTAGEGAKIHAAAVSRDYIVEPRMSICLFCRLLLIF